MTELARELEEAFVGLGAAVAEEHFARGQRLDDLLREPPLGFVIVKVGNVDDFPGLLDEGFGDLRIGVTETAHGNAAAEVEVTLASDVVNITAGAVADGNVEARIARHDMLVKQF